VVLDYLLLLVQLKTMTTHTHLLTSTPHLPLRTISTITLPPMTTTGSMTGTEAIQAMKTTGIVEEDTTTRRNMLEKVMLLLLLLLVTGKVVVALVVALVAAEAILSSTGIDIN
jgi:hypothetical protein